MYQHLKGRLGRSGTLVCTKGEDDVICAQEVLKAAAEPQLQQTFESARVKSLTAVCSSSVGNE